MQIYMSSGDMYILLRHLPAVKDNKHRNQKVVQYILKIRTLWVWKPVDLATNQFWNIETYSAPGTRWCWLINFFK